MTSSSSKRLLVTIVVPTFNVEKYVQRCLDSIINQTYDNIEVIVIDDGSDDSTLEAIDKIRRKDSRITLIKQNHFGPNEARKRGVELAKGEYLMFVDSDDYLDENAVEVLVDKFRTKRNLDSIRFGAVKESSGLLVHPILSPGEKERIISRSEIVELLVTSDMLNSLWSQIYKTKRMRLIKAFNYKIEFGEDVLVNLEYHDNSRKILVIDDVLYYYCDNPNSTTLSKKRDRLVKNVKDGLFVTNKIISFIRTEKINDKKKIEANYTQFASLCDTVLCLSKIKNYKFSEFKSDFAGVFISSPLNEQERRVLRQYIWGLSLKEVVKHGIITELILSNKMKTLWFCIVCGRWRLLLHQKIKGAKCR